MKKALMIYGGWEGHTPRESTEKVAAVLRDSGFNLDICEGTERYADARFLASLDLVVQCVTMSEITPPQWEGLRDAVKAGTGFGGWHGGVIDSFRANTDYQWMTGGQWVAHPGNCIPEYRVKISDREHPITHGLNDFTLLNTEQYYIHADPGNHLLCETTFSGGHGDTELYPPHVVMPYAWTRSWGKGRVFVACWGHTDKDFDVPEALEIVRRGLVWAAR